MFDTTSGGCAAAVKARQVVYAVAAAPDGKAAAYGGLDEERVDWHNVVEAFGPDDGKPGREFVWETLWKGHPIGSLSYSADGEYLAAAGFYPSAEREGAGSQWWRRGGSNQSGDMANRRAGLAQFGPSGSSIAVAARGVVVLWESPSRAGGKRPWPLRGGHPRCLAFLGPDSFVVAVGSFLRFLPLTEAGGSVTTGEPYPAALAASPDGRALLTAGRSGVVECYDAHSRTLRSRHDFGVGPVHGLAFAPDGLTFAVAGEGGVVVCDAE